MTGRIVSIVISVVPVTVTVIIFSMTRGGMT
jgi:hypothetical protein